MADQAAKPKRRRVAKKESAPALDPAEDLADSMVDELVSAMPPSLETIDQLRQRKKIQVMQELEDFRASFSRGYAVILAELAKKGGGQDTH